MEYVNNLTKGSGKGKIGAVLGITSVISFKNLHIGHTTLKTYKDFLEQYVGYDLSRRTWVPSP
jgi:hypothetical protein